MKCPSCNDITLLISSRANVEIDYCPQCRGVWLDRGELDKIIERSDGQEPEATVHLAGPTRGHDDRDRDWDDDDDDRRASRYGKKRKRRSFLADMFEFGE